MALPSHVTRFPEPTNTREECTSHAATFPPFHSYLTFLTRPNTLSFKTGERHGKRSSEVPSADASTDLFHLINVQCTRVHASAFANSDTCVCVSAVNWLLKKKTKLRLSRVSESRGGKAYLCSKLRSLQRSTFGAGKKKDQDAKRQEKKKQGSLGLKDEHTRPAERDPVGLKTNQITRKTGTNGRHGREDQETNE